MGRSKRLFAPGFFTLFMSRNIDPALRINWNRLMGLSFGSGVATFLGTQMISSVLPTYTGKPYSGKKCNIRTGQDSSAEAFGLGMFQNLFIMCFVFYFFSLLVLMMEKKVGKISRIRFGAQILCKHVCDICAHAFVRVGDKKCTSVRKVFSR